MNLSSYDRLFPSQDVLQTGGPGRGVEGFAALPPADVRHEATALPGPTSAIGPLNGVAQPTGSELPRPGW
jgi:hypothetical protein